MKGSNLAIVTGLYASGLALRLHSPFPADVWLDEAVSVLSASQPLPDVIRTQIREAAPPLYYVLLHFGIALFGDEAGALRGISAAFGALLSPALFLVGRRLFGPTAATVAAVLALVSPLHVFYSQQIRMYSLFPVLTLAFFAATWTALDRTERRPWTLAVLSALAVLWTHNYGMFAVAAAPVAWLVRGPHTRDAARRLALTLLIIGVVDLLWLPVVLGAESATSAWVRRFFPGAGALLQSLLLFGAGADHPIYLDALAWDSPVAAWSTAWLALALGGATVALLRTPALRRDLFALGAFLLVPMLIPLGMSLVGTPIYLVGRYEIGAYPAFCLLLGAGAEAARRTSRRWGAAAVVFAVAAYLALAFVTLEHSFRERSLFRTDEKIAETLGDVAEGNDVLLMAGQCRAPIVYYLRRLGLEDRFRVESFPAVTGETLGFYDSDALLADDAALYEEAIQLADRYRRDGERVLLVDDPENDPAIAEINRRLREVLDRACLRREVVVRTMEEGAGGEPQERVVAYRFGP